MIKNVYKAMIDYKTGKEQARKVYKQATDHIKANYVEGSELYRFSMDTAKDVFRKESQPLEGKYKEVIKADFEAVKKAIREAVTTPPTAGVMNLLGLIEKYIGLTGSAYVAIPCVAPIALGGFYSFNGMNFYEYMGKKLHFMFGNRALTYVSTEGEPAIKQLEAEQNEQVKKKGRKAEPETVTADSAVKKQEEFEAMKKKTRNMLLGLVAVIVAIAAGIAAYKAMH